MTPDRQFQELIMATPGFQIWDHAMAWWFDQYMSLGLKAYYATPFILGNADAWADLQKQFMNPATWIARNGICRF